MIDCKSIVARLKKELKKEVDEIKKQGKTITLAIIQVGDNPASDHYVAGKLDDCWEVGITTKFYRFPETSTDRDVADLIEFFNKEPTVDGIILQLPLPSHLHEDYLTGLITVDKDVDGFSSCSDFTPCTPKGVMTLLKELDLENLGWTRVTLVGKGKLVGKPLIPLLLDAGATLTVCGSQTTATDLIVAIRNADIVISAVGRHGLITSEIVKPRQIIIDCGIEVIGGKQYGDCSSLVYEHVDMVTPRVDGMGLLTRLSLLQNTVEAYKLRHKAAGCKG